MSRSRSTPPRRRTGGRTGVRLAIAIALSLGSNAAIWALLAARGAFSPPPTPATARPVTLAPLVGAEWDANRAVKPEPPPPPALAQRRRLPAGEVVELPPDEGQPAQPPPDDARYLSDRDRRVERETVSRYAGNYPNLLPVPQPGAPGREAAGQGGRGQRTARGAGEEGKGDRARKDAANAQEKLAAAPTSERKSVQRDEGGPEEPPSPSPGPDRMTGPTKPDLSLGPETIARIMGGPGMAGYGQAEEGAVTALNTRDGGELARYYIHAAWKIEPDWIRRVRGAAAERDPDGQLFFYKERTVVVAATLDTNGNLMEVSVVRSSNVDFFDRVAVSSIRQAQPFAPPPASMLFDGRARMAWTFTLYPPERRSSVSGRPLR